MTNFAFLQAVGWPEAYADCARAESYALSDPRAACIYSRRAAEQVVDYLYDVLRLPVPYANDLSARINDAGFKAKTGMGIAAKLNLIRRLGNSAAHDQQPIPPRAALDALKELHHVMVWAAFHHSADPQAAPMKSVFDPCSERLHRGLPVEADEGFLDGTQFSTNQIHFVNLIVDELASNGTVEPARLYESPYTDLTARGPQAMFTTDQVQNIVSILNTVRDNATAAEGVA